MAVPREKHPGGRPRLYNSPEEMQELINQYFTECREHTETIDGKETSKPLPLTMSGLAVALGMDRRSLVNYSNRDEFFPTLQKARDIVEADMECRLLQGKGSPIGFIFGLKNNFAWVDKQEIDVNSQVSLSVKDDIEDTVDSE